MTPLQKFSGPVAKIGVFTSGGDAPGMNAAIRSVTRMALTRGWEVLGIRSGYAGMVAQDWSPLEKRGMGNIIQRGGTILKTGRFPEFHRPEVRTKAAQHLKAAGINALVCIGGDGSMTGAHALWLEHQVPIVSLPGTIDNDIWGTETSIGFDTAVNTALGAIDKIRDTADSHDRLFIVEVMGRNSGFIASAVGLAGGAEEVFVPDAHLSIDKVVDKILQAHKEGKKSSILIAAEGQKPGRAYDLAEQLRKKAQLDAKVSILGHQQRGGTPSAMDRVLATRMGAAAVQVLAQGECDCMIGLEAGKMVTVPLALALAQKKTTPMELVQLASLLA